MLYKATNTTSATSFFYHPTPSWSSGYPMGNWTQVYIWKEKIKCCKKQNKTINKKLFQLCP